MLRALVCFCNFAKGKSQSQIQSCHYEQEKSKVCVLRGGIDGWTAEGQLGKCWGRLTEQDTLRIAPPWLFWSSCLSSLICSYCSALASEAHTHLLTMGRALLPCAARAGQEMPIYSPWLLIMPGFAWGWEARRTPQSELFCAPLN